MRRLGFEATGTLDLILIALFPALLLGELFSLETIRKPELSLRILLNPFSAPVSLLVGTLAFFWYCNRRKWSIFEVGDSCAPALALGALLFGLIHIGLSFINKASLGASDYLSLTGALFLILFNLTIFESKLLRGYKLFLSLLIISGILGLNVNWTPASTGYSLTFLVAILILSLVGLARRLRKNLMDSPLDLITRLRHRLLERQQLLKEQQLKLPQDDPFYDSQRRVEPTSEEEGADEQVGHRDVLAQGAFLADSQKQVDKALSKMESGTYGICEKCGGKIEAERLEADPAASLCIKCARGAGR